MSSSTKCQNTGCNNDVLGGFLLCEDHVTSQCIRMFNSIKLVATNLIKFGLPEYMVDHGRSTIRQECKFHDCKSNDYPGFTFCQEHLINELVNVSTHRKLTPDIVKNIEFPMYLINDEKKEIETQISQPFSRFSIEAAIVPKSEAKSKSKNNKNEHGDANPDCKTCSGSGSIFVDGGIFGHCPDCFGFSRLPCPSNCKIRGE